MITKEQAIYLLKRKKRASQYATYCASVGCCNYDGDSVLLYQSKEHWNRIKKIANDNTQMQKVSMVG